MPIRPPPMHYTCCACGWSKTVAPLSDALGPGDFYSACPQCSHAPLDTQRAGASAVLGDWVQNPARFEGKPFYPVVAD